MEFKALHIPALTDEVSVFMEFGLLSFPGFEQLYISL
jgi:hypothetical protein